MSNSVLPKSIKIGYKNYNIHDYRGIRGRDEDGDCTLGKTEIDKQSIKIFNHNTDNESVKMFEECNTVLHELGHAAVDAYGLSDFLGGNDAEERIVNAFANIYTELFLRNPELLKYINKIAKAYENEQSN